MGLLLFLKLFIMKLGGDFMRKIAVWVVAFLLILSFVGCKGGGTAKTTSNLTVTVLDEGNKPISKVSLELDGSMGVTDEKGVYVFKDLNEGSYTVNATLEGFEDVSKTVDIVKGADKDLTISLVKPQTQTEEELKDLSEIKSYVCSYVSKTKDGKSTTMTLEINDYGKRQHLIAIDEEGELSTDFYLVGDKAIIKSGDEWIEFTGEEATSMGVTFSSFTTNFVADARSWYNDLVKFPGGTASFKHLGKETMNGYPTDKYQYILEGKALGEGIDKMTVTYWVINKGQFKNYATRLVMDYILSGDSEESSPNFFEFNFTRLGEDIEIKFP